MTDLRILKTRNNLQQALLNLLQEDNYADISIDLICKQALCSRSTFYAHYGNKDELVQEIISNYLAEFSDHLTHRLQIYNSRDFMKVIHLITKEFINSNRNNLLSLLKSPETANYFFGKLEYIFQSNFINKYPTQPIIIAKLYATNAVTILGMLIRDEIDEDDFKIIANIQANIFKQLKKET